MWLEFETDRAIDENAGMSMGMKENRLKSIETGETRLKSMQGMNPAFATGRKLGLGEVSMFASLKGVDGKLRVSPSLPRLRWRRFWHACCIVGAAAHVARWFLSGDHLEVVASAARNILCCACVDMGNNFFLCRREMANSSSVVVWEGDEGLQKKSQRILEQIKKKVPHRGKLSQSPGGGMMMLDGCAGLGEHGRKKDKSK
ncbi:hypothetical protein N431DRAFT_548972 [Stipitochalara longipes BDJ]|nr:hypothetical protein N431DRAFT_548972 [Stipitochalara longipes BDJ]